MPMKNKFDVLCCSYQRIIWTFKIKEHLRMTVKSSIKKFDEIVFIVFIVFASSLSWPLILFRKHHPNNKTKLNTKDTKQYQRLILICLVYKLKLYEMEIRL